MEDAEVDLRRVFGLIGRRIKLIGAMTAAAVCVGFAFLFLATPIYTATSLLIIDPRQTDLLDEEAGRVPNVDNARIESEAELLRSDTILLKVIAEQQLHADPAFTPPSEPSARLAGSAGLNDKAQAPLLHKPAQALARLRKAVSVQRRGPTYLIAVQVQSAEPALAAKLANAIAQTYIDEQIASKVSALLSARDVLEVRMAAAREEIVLSDGAFNAFLRRSAEKLASQPGGSNIESLREDLAALDATGLQTTQLIQVIDTSLSENDWDALLAALSPEQSGVLGEQRRLLAQQISAADQGSQQHAQFQTHMMSLEQHLARTGADQLADLRADLAAMDMQQAAKREQLRDQIMQSNLPADMLTGLYDLQGKASFARDQYQSLLTRSLQLQSQSTLQLPDSRIASPAFPPSAPSFPSKAVFVGVALLIGVLLGVLISVIVEAVVGGFMGPEQLEATLKIQVAASLPKLALEPGNDTLADLVITAPLSQFSEAMRRMRLVVDQASGSRSGRVVMVTSAVPGEGKTTTAIGLARSYALSGLKTLLIDCDLRQPRIGTETGIIPKASLLDLLEQRSAAIDLQTSIAHEPETGLCLLAGLNGSERPTDQLLASARFNHIINQALQHFDVVLLDTPAIEPVVDALYLASQADLIVLVTRWASTPQRDAKRTLSALLRARKPSAPIIGLVNGWAQPKAGLHKKNRRFYDADFGWEPSRLLPLKTEPAVHSYKPPRIGSFEHQHSSKNSLRDALDELDA